jgi:hypothetical protein
MTEEALRGLIPFLDFVNVGLKGMSDKIYVDCGVKEFFPVIRSLKSLYEQGIYLEVASIYKKGGDEELRRIAEYVASLSVDIPFQVMRFLPMGEANAEEEPSIKEAERLCDELRQRLHYVYLFNSPGSEYLDSSCPQCSEKIIERGFYGPMCSSVFRLATDATCSCGFRLPFKGDIHEASPEETGYFGGYRIVNALNMIRALLALIGVYEKERIDEVLFKVLKDEFIKGLFYRLNGIDSYLDTVDYFAELTGSQAKAGRYREYITEKVRGIKEQAEGLEKPSVYCCLGHPLIAVFHEKLEARLVEIAGGQCVNGLIQRDMTPGVRVPKEEFKRLNPEIIFNAGSRACPLADFIGYCKGHDLEVPAVRKGKIFDIHPYQTSVSPDWILGLLALCNEIHPDVFSFDLEEEANDFFLTFFGIPFDANHNRSFQGLRAKSN